jgi:hypothetical protein
VSSPDDEQRRAQLRDERDRELFAIRRETKRLAREEAELEVELGDLAEGQDDAKRDIEEEWRREHWGHDPDPPPAWRRGQQED